MLIGKYPSETLRDGGHFNRYEAGNVFVAERAKAAGLRTVGGGAHWYFAPAFGLTQGMDEWDLSAKPAGGQGDNDTTVTSAALADAALRLLARPENTGGRFFAWFHFVDPHAQYVPHREAPDLLGDAKGYAAAVRAAYDGEVWFTDHHVGRILEYVRSQPWGARTAVIVTADHGEAFGEHGMNWHGFEIWDVLVRVPFVVAVPGLPPRRVAARRGHIDLVPTVLDLLHIEAPPHELSGRSLRNDLLGATPPEERDVLVDMPDGPYTRMRRALITGPGRGMKIIHAGGSQYQLYDLDRDPGEREDLARDKDRLAPFVEALRRARGRLREVEVKAREPAPR
jgi:arylsulfatase A-like enzyme